MQTSDESLFESSKPSVFSKFMTSLSQVSDREIRQLCE